MLILMIGGQSFNDVTLFWGFLQRGKKIDRLNIVLLTDLSTEASSDQLDIIIENLKKSGITLQCL